MSEMTFHLEQFDGPLDLLLHLISKNKVSIYDIPISAILEQYLEILHAQPQMDLDTAGDFIAMAAQLVYIKSKMLLPKPETQEEQQDPRTQLVEQLLEYQRMKEMTPFFREHFEQGRDIVTKPPEPRGEREQVEYHHVPNDLIRAARALLERVQRRTPPSARAFEGIVGRETVPVHTKITMILKRFFTQPRIYFQSLFENAKSRSEVVATFLAVLELSKTKRVTIEGEGEQVALTLTEEKEHDDTT